MTASDYLGREIGVGDTVIFALASRDSSLRQGIIEGIQEPIWDHLDPTLLIRSNAGRSVLRHPKEVIVKPND